MDKQDPNFDAVVNGTLNKLAKTNSGVFDRLTEYHMVMSHNRPVYKQQGDFTIAMLVDKSTGETVGVGVSKRNPTDDRNPLRGRSLALSRAVVDFVKTTQRSIRHTVKGVRDTQSRQVTEPFHDTDEEIGENFGLEDGETLVGGMPFGRV